MNIKRSNVEFSKRVWLDRWTANAPYVYAGYYNAFNFGIGGDCSGVDGIFIGAVILGPQQMAWARAFSTETFPGPFQGFRKVNQAEMLSSASPIKVMIYHGGGGPNSHMACVIDDWQMESNGSSNGTCGGPNNADGNGTPPDSSYWNDWWVYDGGIDEDTTDRQQFGYPRVLDYAGGRIPGAVLKAAGISAVCRYISDGGASLPYKLLVADEVADLHANSVGIAPNWETTADMMLGGNAAGVSDAHAARSKCDELGFPPDQLIYFSADFDATPAQQAQIDDYLRGVATVIGFEQTGIYGGYWPVSRALTNGTAARGWQTEAWSTLNPDNGINIDSRVVLVQRNVTQSNGITLSDVPTDINDLHGNLGAWTGTNVAPAEPPPAVSAFPDGLSDRQLLELIATQLVGLTGHGWEQLGQNTKSENLTLVDSTGQIHSAVVKHERNENG